MSNPVKSLLRPLVRLARRALFPQGAMLVQRVERLEYRLLIYFSDRWDAATQPEMAFHLAARKAA
jgi:hypothetical protein